MVPKPRCENESFKASCSKEGSLARYIDVAQAPKAIDARELMVWLLAVVLLAGVGIISIYQSGRTFDRVVSNSDFAAYYCAGAVARVRADPYQARPLERCRAGTANPAPLPGYVTAFFSPISFLPYEPAALSWTVLLAIAVIATVLALRAATGVSAIGLAAAVTGTDLIAGLTFGQLSVIAVLGLSLVAMFLTQGFPRAAAIAALLTLVEPQIGIPVVLGLLLWIPRARFILVLGVAFLIALSILHLGPRQNAEYLSRALPAFFAGEVPFRFQYGFAWILYFFGIDESAALQVATFQYGLTTLLALGLAPVVARRLDAPGLVAAFPAAAATLGGPGLHLSDLAAAIPLVTLVAGSRSRARGLAWLALVLLSIPWITLESVEQTALAAAVVAIVALFTLGDSPWLVRATIGVVAIVLVFGTPRIVEGIPANAVRPAPTTQSFAELNFDPSLAAVVHANVLRDQPLLSEASWPTFALKAPDWAGVSLAFVAALAALRAGDRGTVEEDRDDEEEAEDEDLGYLRVPKRSTA